MTRHERAVISAGPSLVDVLREIAAHPRRILLHRWNWKSAVTSALVRGAIFFAVNLRAGLDAASAAFVTEVVFRVLTSGFYGALTQQLSRAQPGWQGMLGAMVLLPVANHTLEFLAHWGRGTEELGASIAVSVAFTVLSTTFHFFVMRRGLMLVGEGSQTLSEDMIQMPRAVALFVAAPFLWARALANGKSGRRPPPDSSR